MLYDKDILLDSKLSDLKGTLANVVELMRVQASHKKIWLQLYNHTTAKSHFVDQKRIEQVVIQLLSNAIKFSNTGSNVQIFVKELGSMKSGLKIQISVIDKGIGIQPTDLVHIFEPHRQSSWKESRARNPNGRGLGLVMCKRIAEAMKGSIKITSEPHE